MKKAIAVIALAMVAALSLCLIGCSNKQVEVSLNQKVKTDDYEFVFTNSRWAEIDSKGQAVINENTLPIITQREIKVDIGEGNSLALIEGEFANLSINKCNLEDAFVVKARLNDEYECDAFVHKLESDSIIIKSQTTEGIFLGIVIPSEMKDQLTSAEIQWGISNGFQKANKFDDCPAIYTMHFKQPSSA